jgi:hypothetical protein
MFMNDEPMKNILLFVHVPKTAGTSFRKSLESQSKAKMLYDYGQHPESSPALLENLHEDGSIKDESIFDTDRLNVICGHVRYQKYVRCAAPEQVMSILRNPVERVVSEYQHLVRHAGMAMSFDEFVATPRQINKQFRMLEGTDIAGGGLFGLTSHYDCFLELVNRRFGLTLVASTLNKAPESDHEERFSIPVEAINRAFELNRKDLALFFGVAKQFRKALQAVGIATAPPKDAQCNCRLDRDRKVVGWVAREDAECIFVELRVNGQHRVIVSLDQERPDVMKQGLSNNPLCGFSYPLTLLGAGPGDEVAMRVAGAPHCSKTLTVPAE